jgi:hypothetical protein
MATNPEAPPGKKRVIRLKRTPKNSDIVNSLRAPLGVTKPCCPKLDLSAPKKRNGMSAVKKRPRVETQLREGLMFEIRSEVWWSPRAKAKRMKHLVTPAFADMGFTEINV